jgi:hypothetical protein
VLDADGGVDRAGILVNSTLKQLNYSQTSFIEFGSQPILEKNDNDPNYNIQSSGSHFFSCDNIVSDVIAVGANQGNDYFSAFWNSGFGSPEGVVKAHIGSMYSRLDGAENTALYVKTETGFSGWKAVAFN